jgi:hypothetical protein
VSRIVCGWYTPDYAKWADELAASCTRVGESFDLVAVEKRTGGWESETQRKPLMVRDALVKHGDKDLIVFIDVDATVEKPLDELQRSFRGDIGLYCRARVRTRRHIFFRSGTIALTPGEHTSAFIDAWCVEAGQSEYGTVDQDSLLRAVEQAKNATLQMLPIAYCATKHDIENGLVAFEQVVILHEQASFSSAEKESWLSKRTRRVISALKYKD